MTIEATRPPALKRQYPHVDDITDWRAQQTIRLLWDRIFDLESRLQASQSTIETLVDSQNETDANLRRVEGHALEALAIAQRPEDSTDIEGSEGAGDALPGGGDGGAGADGCAAAGVDGHFDPAGDLSAYNAGKIICGTGNEFPALLLATAAGETGDPAAIAARESNAEELVLRCIWHLQAAGFTAGRQLNPSGIASKTRVCVEVDSGVVDPPTYLREYDIFFQAGVYWEDMSTQMVEGAGASLIPDSGTPD
jgi:hypothetical protein